MSEPQSLSLEAGECATLTPGSSRFKGVYQQMLPRSADHVRELLSFTGAAAEDLDAKDAETRANARNLTYQAFNAYVHGDNAASLAHMKPAFDRYLEIH